ELLDLSSFPTRRSSDLLEVIDSMSIKDELKDRLIKEVEDNKDDLIDFCSKLIQIPSENPPGDSTEITQFIDDYLKNVGAETTWRSEEHTSELQSRFDLV